MPDHDSTDVLGAWSCHGLGVCQGFQGCCYFMDPIFEHELKATQTDTFARGANPACQLEGQNVLPLFGDH